MLAAALLLLFAEPKINPDVTYSKAAGEELKMDIYRPATQRGNMPAVVVIHGGAWMSGKRTDMSQMAQELAKRGVVAATITYRLAPKHKWPAMLDDAQTAVRFLRANAKKYSIDPKKIGATGASAGGHLSVFLGVIDTRDPKPKEYPGFSSKVKAVLDIFGPTDLTDANDFPQNSMTDLMAVTVFGKKFAEAAEIAKAASPLHFVTKDDAPIFIVQGMADMLVRPNQSMKLEKKLKECGLRCDSAYIEGMGHEMPLEKPEVKSAMERAVAWFLAELKR